MKIYNPQIGFAIVIACLAIPGCTVGPTYEPPEPLAVATSSYEPAAREEGSLMPADWWSVFADPVLEKLMQQALSSNLTLEMAQARIRQAQAIYQSETGRNQPFLTASGGLNRMQMSENSRSGMMLKMGGERTTNELSGSLNASWELDILGRNQYFADAAQAQLRSTEYAYADLQNTVRAEIAQQYFNLRYGEIRLSILERNLQLQRRIVELEEARHAAGTSDELKLTQARQVLLAEESKQAPLRASWESSLLAIATLIPEDPNRLKETLQQQPFTIPEPGNVFGHAIPSELLKRRPDVRIAEQQLNAETAILGIRATDLYPRFNLLGSLGQESIDLGDILSRASNFWNFGAGFSVPLFTGNRLQSLKEAQQAKVDQAVSAYQATMISAIRDTERSVILVHYGKSDVEQAKLLYDNATAAAELAEKQYRAGVTPLDQYIHLQKQLNLAEENLELSRIKLSKYLIALGQSLGGGWTESITGQDSI